MIDKMRKAKACEVIEIKGIPPRWDLSPFEYFLIDPEVIEEICNGSPLLLLGYVQFLTAQQRGNLALKILSEKRLCKFDGKSV